MPLPEVMVLRHVYGMVTAVASGNAAVTLTRDFPTQPLLSPETATPTLQILTVTADPTNGTIFHDLDAKTTSVIKDFSTVGAGLVGRYIRTATRFQADGTLVAVRMWASSAFNNVWAGPEGHVDHVTLGSATTPYTIHVQNESGAPSPIVSNNGTKFFLRSPTNAQADATALATGTGFLDAMNLLRFWEVTHPCACNSRSAARMVLTVTPIWSARSRTPGWAMPGRIRPPTVRVCLGTAEP